MLGEQIAELKGKVTSQRVLDIEGPSIETSVSVSGSLKGVQILGDESIGRIDPSGSVNWRGSVSGNGSSNNNHT